MKRLWGQPYVAPIYALLLHRWMLLRKDAGGLVQRQKHVGVLVFGARPGPCGCTAAGVCIACVFRSMLVWPCTAWLHCAMLRSHNLHVDQHVDQHDALCGACALEGPTICRRLGDLVPTDTSLSGSDTHSLLSML